MIRRALTFNADQFAWRHDLGDCVVVYEFGGSRVLILRGHLRDQFVAAVKQGDYAAGLDPLISLGVLRADEEPR